MDTINTTSEMSSKNQPKKSIAIEEIKSSTTNGPEYQKELRYFES